MRVYCITGRTDTGDNRSRGEREQRVGLYRGGIVRLAAARHAPGPEGHFK